MRFPSDPELLKQWMKFCFKESLNTKNASVCMEHFKADDFANKMEYENGFATKLYLKRGAVPTIREICDDKNDPLIQEAQKSENKKIVEQLIKEYDAASALLNGKVLKMETEETLVHPKEEIEIHEHEWEKENVANSDDTSEIEKLKNEMKRLREENFDLSKRYKKKIIEMEKERKIFETKLKFFKKSLAKTSFKLKDLEEKLLGIFTKGQVAKLKSGKRKTWTEEDITHSITLYSASAKLYKLMYRKRFPLPAIRTLQAWTQKANNTPTLLDHEIKIE